MIIEIIGIYPVSANEPCHLVELWVRGLNGKISMRSFTQEVKGQPQANWQVPWDERVLNDTGTAPIGKPFPTPIEADGTDVRLAFFFHYLDFSKPLLTPAGRVPLPAEMTMPSRLAFLQYESPC